jgi:multidrug efflux pump subunit AcrA (membrane-fusion protein)
MTLRTFAARGAALLLAASVVTAALLTRDRWQPLLCPAAVAEKSDHAEHDHARHDHGTARDRVKLSAAAQANLKLDVDMLEPRPWWRSIAIPGQVVDRPGESDRVITSRIAGVVQTVQAKPGDVLKAGDPLFKIQIISEIIQNTQGELAKAAQELRIATLKRDRTAGLVRIGTTSEALLVEDEAGVKRFANLVQQYRRQLQASGFTTEQLDAAEKGEPVTEIALAAPGDAKATYEVQDLKVQLGEVVQAGQALGTLSNHARLFVEARAFKSEAILLTAAAIARTPVATTFMDETPGTWPEQAPLTIHHLSNQVDPATRTLGVFLELENQSQMLQQDQRTRIAWRYRPGQRVRLRVPVEKLGDSVFILPAAAVVREGAEAFVFVQNGDLFMRKAVRVLHESATEFIVANDGTISPAMFVVKNQASALNRAIKAGEGGGGHEGHDHSHGH